MTPLKLFSRLKQEAAMAKLAASEAATFCAHQVIDFISFSSWIIAKKQEKIG